MLALATRGSFQSQALNGRLGQRFSTREDMLMSLNVFLCLLISYVVYMHCIALSCSLHAFHMYFVWLMYYGLGPRAYKANIYVVCM